MDDTAFNIFSFINLLGGLSIFLFGMRFSERGLKKSAGIKLKKTIELITKNRLAGFGVGLIVTLFTQSSNVTTAILIGFTGAGLITLLQTLSIILGALVGSCVIVQLIAFKIYKIAPLIILIGFLLFSFNKRRSQKLVGQIILGLGFVLFGIDMMSGAVGPLRQTPAFLKLFLYCLNFPLLSLLVGILVTGIVQSSTLTLGLLIFLTFSSGPHALAEVNIYNLLPFVIGVNMGSSVAVLIASIGSDSKSRSVALAHVLFKFSGAFLFYLFIRPIGNLLSQFHPDLHIQIANAHTFLNLAVAVFFLPLLSPVGRLLSHWRSKAENGEDEYQPKYLKEADLDNPVVALSQAQKEIYRMAAVTLHMLKSTIQVFTHHDPVLRQQIIKQDDKIDNLDEAVTPFLTRLSREEMTDDFSKREVMLLFISHALEQISDLISKNIMDYAGKIFEEGFSFSREGFEEIRLFHGEILKNLRLAIRAFRTNNTPLARQVWQERTTIKELEEKFHRSHINRLHQGVRGAVETSTITLDLLNDLKRINSHSVLIAQAVMGKV